MAQSFESLPLAKRARRYREMADAALVNARQTQDPVMRAEYLILAASWHTMAQEIEKGPAGRAQLEQSSDRLRRSRRKATH